MVNLNFYRKASISSLEFGSSQKVDLGNGLVFLKDCPRYNEDGTHFFSFTVRNLKIGDLECAGSANTLKELKASAKSFK